MIPRSVSTGRSFTTCQQRNECSRQTKVVTISKRSKIDERMWNTYVHIVEALEDVRQLPMVSDVLVDLDFALQVI